MHPVFVEAVKKNQIGVAPQESTFLVSTAPGTIPVTVRPPRIPELADAPVVAGVAHTRPSQARYRRPRWPLPKPSPQPQRPHDRAAAACSAACSRPNRPKPRPLRKAKAQSIAWRDWSASAATTKSAKTAEKAAPKPKPAAKPTNVASHGAIRSRPTEAPQPIKTTEAQAAAPAAAAPAQARVAAPASTAMNGAAPVVQTGSFDSRWSGFR